MLLMSTWFLHTVWLHTAIRSFKDTLFLCILHDNIVLFVCIASEPIKNKTDLMKYNNPEDLFLLEERYDVRKSKQNSLKQILWNQSNLTGLTLSMNLATF